MHYSRFKIMAMTANPVNEALLGIFTSIISVRPD
jgi:hypothetical protein